ncbi:hypothetical protein D8674_040941 [Pyrus ussuriensis x Pyrus communis]|uniref:Uncharacterized protein n=1 Tax=Pyrus ussuriensis x Pyrus communis TaxID=2448454 RepID=A0A5N5FFN5_9ROSA|nr:hypothetical protein D8674_040941 [Pyrus ussuriensis x Pyrus communis]
MARVLTLDFQLDCLDYESENWYHADLDFETFKLLQEEKGESFFTFARDMTVRSTKAMIQTVSIPEGLGPWRSKLLWAARVASDATCWPSHYRRCVCADTGSQESEFPELEALSRLDLGAAMKVFLAKRLTSEFTQATADVEESSVIIGERNRAAIDALQKAIDSGNNKIAILWRGSHARPGETIAGVGADPYSGTMDFRMVHKEAGSEEQFPSISEDDGGSIRLAFEPLPDLGIAHIFHGPRVGSMVWELFFGTAVNWTYQLASQVTEYIDNAGMICRNSLRIPLL